MNKIKDAIRMLEDDIQEPLYGDRVIKNCKTALAALKTLSKIHPDFCYSGKEILISFHAFQKEGAE